MFGWFHSIFSLIFVIVGCVIFAAGFYFFKQKRLIENIPTSKVRSLAMGLVEVNGTVVPVEGKLLHSPLAQKDCVYYRYLVQRHETTRDSKGHSQSRWVTVQDDRYSVPFYLQDDTGKVLVDPTKAMVDLVTDAQTQRGNMRYQEWCIEPQNTLYIMGTAGRNPGQTEASANHVENIMIQKGQHEKFYFISDSPEKKLLTKFSLVTYLLWVIGGVFIIIGVIVFLSVTEFMRMFL
ncbi:MAG: hypothetical protein JXA00_02310 [Candidatus Thermoplasmatota archaeon]|nr:hypothetical protein [Candidatus Thermoplasmatota archaeon]